jgi:hypothetical protein
MQAAICLDWSGRDVTSGSPWDEPLEKRDGPLYLWLTF